MSKKLILTSKFPLDKLIKSLLELISYRDIICIYTDDNNILGKHYFYIQTRKNLPTEDIAAKISDWILETYEEYVLTDTLKDEFIFFEQDNIYEILEKARNSIKIFYKFYYKYVIVKKITSFLNSNNKIYLDGFVMFRLTEYRRLAEMVICDAIDQLMAEKEYDEFIKLLKEYISDATPSIVLLHIKVNDNGSFSLFNFKKSQIMFAEENVYGCRNIFSNTNELLNIIISIVPKRIIWHNNLMVNNWELINTLELLFEDKFAICKGCDLCLAKDNE